MEYQVTVETVSEQLIAAARQRTTYKLVSKEIGALLSHPWAFIKAHPGIRNDGHNVAIYWDQSGEGSIEVGVQVIAPFEAAGPVVCSATPAGRVARTAHYGPYSELGKPHEAVRRWCREKGHPIVTPYWEIYGDWDDDPAKVRTDVLYLLK